MQEGLWIRDPAEGVGFLRVVDGACVTAEGRAPETAKITVVGDCLTLDLGADGVQRWYRVRDDVKQVIVYRRDLKMRKGKIAAQVAHASLKAILDRDAGTWEELRVPLAPAMRSWVRARCKKIVLSVDDEEALLAVHAAAIDAGLPTALITDAGHTEFHGVPTRTTCAVGPAEETVIDAITGPGGLVSTRLA